MLEESRCALTSMDWWFQSYFPPDQICEAQVMAVDGLEEDCRQLSRQRAIFKFWIKLHSTALVG